MPKPDHPTDPDRPEDDEFAREIELVRSLSLDPVELADAPAELWDRIAAAAEHDEPVGAQHVPTSDRPIELAARRRRRWAAVIVGAAATIVLIVAVGVFAVHSDDTPTELAAAELLPYEGAQVGNAGGEVELIDDGEQLSLRVDMHDLPAPAPGTFYELWLIDPGSGEPLSVATMKDGSSDVAIDIPLPEGADPDRFAVVDVSIQEAGAGPEHSGNSVLRGTLTA